MNIYEIIFIVISILIGGGGVAYFATQQQYVAAALFLIGSIAVLVSYGLRWFGPAGSPTSTTVPWPPVINTCPDYLTYYKRTNGGAVTDTCIDRVGVSRNGAITIWPSGGGDPTNDAYFFTLKKGEDRSALCGRVINAGLTWEGVTDGESCSSSGGGSTSSSGSAGTITPSGSCPGGSTPT